MLLQKPNLGDACLSPEAEDASGDIVILEAINPGNRILTLHERSETFSTVDATIPEHFLPWPQCRHGLLASSYLFDTIPLPLLHLHC